MGQVREYSASGLTRFLGASGYGVQALDDRNHRHLRGRKGKLLDLAYLVAPRRFRREIATVTRKVAPGPWLAPVPRATAIER